MKFKGLKALALLVALHAGLASAQDFSRFNWSRVQLTPGTASESFIDYSRVSGDRNAAMRAWVMSVHQDITSARMWGLSDISEVEVQCIKGTVRLLSTFWTENQFGRGAITKYFMTPNAAPVSIVRLRDGDYHRALFNNLC
jgi:hypothetical protein